MESTLNDRLTTQIGTITTTHNIDGTSSLKKCNNVCVAIIRIILSSDVQEYTEFANFSFAPGATVYANLADLNNNGIILCYVNSSGSLRSENGLTSGHTIYGQIAYIVS